MTQPQIRPLRGFDSYEVRLGDELRGERACMGKSLFDVQRDLRIKANFIDAIENCDASAIPNQSYLAGYVRSYARYLKLDADEVYRRFCDEADIAPRAGARPGNGARMASGAGFGADRRPTPDEASREDPFGSSEFASVLDAPRRLELAPILGAISSLAALAALVVGVGYGGWTFLKNIQQVSLAPAAGAEAIAALPTIGGGPVGEIDQFAYADDGALAGYYDPVEPDSSLFRPSDGPIAAIDPTTAGVYAPAAAEVETAAADIVGDHILAQSAGAAGAEAATLAAARPADQPGAAIGAPLLAVAATTDAWIRIDSPAGDTIFTGILGAGDRFELDPAMAETRLKVGNAGGVVILVGGRPYGPLGASGRVESGILLEPDFVRASYPPASKAVAEQLGVEPDFIENAAIDAGALTGSTTR